MHSFPRDRSHEIEAGFWNSVDSRRRIFAAAQEPELKHFTGHEAFETIMNAAKAGNSKTLQIAEAVGQIGMEISRDASCGRRPCAPRRQGSLLGELARHGLRHVFRD